jgi:hypothetical protein
MKRFFSLLLTGMFIAAFAQAQSDQPVVAENPNAPEISFAKTVHDYGTVYKDGDGTCEFAFTNTGKEPLVLSNVRSSCGCTVPKWTREPILPGQTGVINVKYDTKRMGAINKTITVLSNAKTPSVVLRIKGNVIAPPAESAPVNTGAQGAAPKAN